MNTAPDPRRPRWPLWKIAAVVHAPLLAVLVGLAALEPRTGVPLAGVVRDTVQVAGLPEYVGALSNVGALMWCTAAVACLLSAAVLRRAGRPTARFMLCSGLFTAFLLLDDLFLIHDGILSRELHIGDKKIYAAYAVVLVAYLYAFGRVLLAREPQLLAIALALFATSVVTDLLWLEPRTTRYLLEDGSKLLGIATWAAMLVRIASRELLDAAERPSE